MAKASCGIIIQSINDKNQLHRDRALVSIVMYMEARPGIQLKGYRPQFWLYRVAATTFKKDLVRLHEVPTGLLNHSAETARVSAPL